MTTLVLYSDVKSQFVSNLGDEDDSVFQNKYEIASVDTTYVSEYGIQIIKERSKHLVLVPASYMGKRNIFFQIGTFCKANGDYRFVLEIYNSSLNFVRSVPSDVVSICNADINKSKLLLFSSELLHLSDEKTHYISLNIISNSNEQQQTEVDLCQIKNIFIYFLGDLNPDVAYVLLPNPSLPFLSLLPNRHYLSSPEVYVNLRDSEKIPEYIPPVIGKESDKSIVCSLSPSKIKESSWLVSTFLNQGKNTLWRSGEYIAIENQHLEILFDFGLQEFGLTCIVGEYKENNIGGMEFKVTKKYSVKPVKRGSIKLVLITGQIIKFLVRNEGNNNTINKFILSYRTL